MNHYLTKNELYTNKMLSSWLPLLKTPEAQEALDSALSHVNQRYASNVTVYPAQSDLLNALQYTNLKDIRVVIIGQDPYHGPNQAHGLCFSVREGVNLPPSLRNIYQEIESDLGINMPTHGNLTEWARQGILLLNTVLTVEAGQAHSHKNIGWETLTDLLIKAISDACNHTVFLLWGSHAHKKHLLIDDSKHTILNAPHPSPLSAHRGFFGCKHFSKCNAALLAHKQGVINWQLV